MLWYPDGCDRHALLRVVLNIMRAMLCGLCFSLAPVLGVLLLHLLRLSEGVTTATLALVAGLTCTAMVCVWGGRGVLRCHRQCGG